MSDPKTLRIGHDKAYISFTDAYDNVTTRSVHGELWSVRTRLRVPNLDASALVHLSTHQDGELLAFFELLAREWQGWPGLREWRTAEGGLSFSCAHDGNATVAMATELRDWNLDWVARAIVPVDSGALEQLARDLERFLAA
jgi:hypothetical protein